MAIYGADVVETVFAGEVEYRQLVVFALVALGIFALYSMVYVDEPQMLLPLTWRNG